MDYKSALNKIFSMHQFHIKLGLERIAGLLVQLGNPHKGLKYFHIAGSNGKGSTASFIASILMEAGFKVGLYTSPHLIKFNERIRINGKEIEDDYIAQFVKSVDHFIDSEGPTFFEITTALAFKYFAEAKVDYVVLETGLGGRLDATNVVDPLISIITSISLEHTNILGETIEQIAIEKAGIIKAGAAAVAGKMPEAAQKVLKERCSQLGSPFFPFESFVETGPDYAVVKLEKSNFNIYTTGLKAVYQNRNAVLALKTVDIVMGEKVTTEQLITGLNNVVANTGLQCRYEIMSSEPLVIFDAAHNEEGVEIFISEFSRNYKDYKTRTLIFGAMRDKPIAAMLALLKPFFDEILVCQAGYGRGASTAEIIELAGTVGVNARPLEDPAAFIRGFEKREVGHCLVLLGSIYLLGEIKSALELKKS